MTASIDAATRYAGLAAIETGVTAAKKQAAEELREWCAASGVTKGALESPFGPVTLRENKAGRHISVHDEKAFTEWAKIQNPESVEVFERVRPLDRSAMLGDRFVIVAGSVMDSITGEAVPFAEVVEIDAAPPSPTYGVSEQQRTAKKAATDWAITRASIFVDGVQGMIEQANA